MIVPSEQLLYASTLGSLEDIAKTEACKGMYVHCIFPYQEYEESRKPLEEDLKKLGVIALMWHGKVMVDLSEPQQITHQKELIY